MFSKISHQWARWATNDRWALGSSIFFCLYGLVWLALCFFVFPNATGMLAIGIMMVCIAALLFERTGFIRLIRKSRDDPQGQKCDTLIRDSTMEESGNPTTLSNLSYRWAQGAAGDSLALSKSLYLFINGLAWLALYFFAFPDATFVLAIGIISTYTGVSLFERAGFIQVLRESGGVSQASHSTQRD